MTKTYKDFDGNERTEDFCFNLTEKETIDLRLTSEGGLEKKVQKIIQAQNHKEIIDTITQIIDTAYGVKSLDGKYFDKSPEHLAKFKQTQAYSDIFMELSTNDEEAAKFVVGIVPESLKDEVQKSSNDMNKKLEVVDNLSDVAKAL